MSHWKKARTIVLLFSLLFLLPFTVSAQTAGILPTTCPTGQSLNSAGFCSPNSLPNTTVPATTGACSGLNGTALTQCQNAQAAQSTLQTFKPGVNITSGNTYGGISISGVGGAIASCANVGGFLVSQATSLLSSIGIGKKILNPSSFIGGGSPVLTSDAKTQAALAQQNKTTQCLDGVAYAVAKNTLAQITTKTLNWVNTGLNGNPLYVQNVSSYLNSIKNQQTTAFLSTVQSSDPIFGNALRSSLTFQITGKSDGLINTPLTTPQAQSYASFQTDFTNGGWNAFLNPAYNPIGAFFNAVDTLSTNVNTQQQQATNEIQRNNGFLDMKHCVQYANNGQVSQVAANGTIVNTSTQVGAGLVNQPVCTQWSTTTPGSVISSQVQTVTNTPVQQLVYANKINEVLGSFFDSFVNNLLSKGLRGSGTGNTTLADLGYGSEGDNYVADTSGSSGTGALGYQSSGTGDVNTGDFDITRPQQLRAILQTQEDFLNRTLDAQIALKRIVPAIGALDYCIPGPNPEWQTGLDSNWQTFVSSIQQAPANSPTTLQNVIGALPVVGSIFTAFFSNNTPPPIWPTNAVLADPVTGGNIQINRTFYAASGHAGNITTGSLASALSTAYSSVVSALTYYNTAQNTFDPGINNSNPVGNAFVQAAASDPNPSYVHGFLQDAYTATDSLTGYNQAATTIDQQYDQNISSTQNTIEQMQDILNQVDAIVSTAKTSYIAANPSVNVQCLNQAYVIDTSAITPVARQEPDQQYAEEDAIAQHSLQSSNYFYSARAN